MDILIKAMAQNGDVRIIAAETTGMVSEAARIHGTSPTATAAFGRMLTAGSIMGSMLKNREDSITIQIDGGGPAKGILVTGRTNGLVKGYIVNPEADLPLNQKGKLDVGGLVGREGNLTVIMDQGLREPYVSSVPLYTGEIAEDLAYYYTTSEQLPSAVSLGVLVDTDGSVKKAGGFMIQMMPGANEHIADIIMYRLEEIPSLTAMLSEGKSIKDIISYIFEDMGLEIHEEKVPALYCDCSRASVEKALISIGTEELRKICDDGKDEELVCHFCNTTYIFTNSDLKKLISELESGK
ncbi:Hsp33 family molecular chaperone HslO [Youngiibacter fragilis]|uniref:33 kDa chaperonin n=1 Tax=Youngiibacter fragilis 232.1 TaxID=994573 RepID=V7I500_9CLOT|nr:molecular chaperone Hsp33 [Youngiibacter fragilis 232.1]